MKKKDASIQISAKAFISTLCIILFLMILSGILTKVVPAGTYDHRITEGVDQIVPDSFRFTERPHYPVWRWFTAPFEVFAAPGNIVVITLIILMILIGGSFTIMDKTGILKVMLSLVVNRFRKNKYILMAMVIFFFMFTASVLGIYEEMAPLVVFIVPLALLLGWDSLTGLGMSLLALAFGFAASIFNPFTIGVAQTIAGLPLFSGAWLRIIFFVCVYAAVFLFVKAHAKKVEKNPERSLVYKEDCGLRAHLKADTLYSEQDLRKNSAMIRAVTWVTAWFLLAVVFVLTVTRFKGVSDYAFPIMGLMFFTACFGGGLMGGAGFRSTGLFFLKGVLAMLPAIVLIVMAISVKQIILGGGIMDTILYSASERIKGANPFVAALLIYALTLFLEFFIASASAKAFLMMPILAPLADLVGITRQTAVLAFDFGDGFSNMIYPSNALLMIALGLTVVSYPKWMRWTLPLQGLMVILCLAFLAIAVAVRFGPF